MRSSTFIAVMVFVVLGATAIWLLNRKPERGISRINFAALDANKVDHIVVAGPMPVDLQKKGDSWHLANGREADLDMVRNLLSSTNRTQSSDVLTEDAGRYAEFEVDEAKGTHVTLQSGGLSVADFIMGKSLTGGAAVRVGDAVYKVTSAYPGAFAHSGTDWLQRRLFSENVQDVARLNVHLHDQAPYNLIAKNHVWGVLYEDESKAHEMRFDASAGENLVASLVNVRAQAILDTDPGAALTQLGPQSDAFTWYIQHKGAAGEVKEVFHTLRLGANKDDKSVYAQVEGRADIYVLPTFAATTLRKKLTDLRDMSVMAGIDPAQVLTLTWVDGKRRLSLSRDKDGEPWRFAGEKPPAGFELDPDKVTRRIQSVAHAKALSLATQQSPQVTGLTSPKSLITMILADKSVLTLAMGAPAKEAPNSVYVRGTADTQIYCLPTAVRDNLLGGIATLKKEAQVDPLAQLDPKMLSQLPPEVRAGLQQQIAQKRREQQMLKAMQEQAAR